LGAGWRTFPANEAREPPIEVECANTVPAGGGQTRTYEHCPRWVGLLSENTGCCELLDLRTPSNAERALRATLTSLGFEQGELRWREDSGAPRSAN
jgi:hypothetical protein